MMNESAPFPAREGPPYEKWQEAAIAGWQAVPDVLLKNQHQLGLSSTELLVLLNVLSFWWYADELPFPRGTAIAKRMGISPRTVQRALQALIDRGLLATTRITDRHNKERDVLDPNGLVQILRKLAVDDPAFLHRLHRLPPQDVEYQKMEGQSETARLL